MSRLQYRKNSALIGLAAFILVAALSCNKQRGISSSLDGSALTSAPQSISEFYNALRIKRNLPDWRLALDGQLTNDNTYFHSAPEGINGWVEFRIIPLTKGEPLLVYIETECGSRGCLQELFFYRYQNGEFKDITEKTMPPIDDVKIMAPYVKYTEEPVELWYDISRSPTQIDAIVYAPLNPDWLETKKIKGKKIFTLELFGERFVKKG